MKRKSQFQSRSGKTKVGKQLEKSSGKSVPDNKRALVVRRISSVPAGKVSSYGAIAAAAGWPGAARQVVRVLRQTQGLPWHRVLGAGGAIKLTGENAAEQKLRLRMEGRDVSRGAGGYAKT